VNKGILCGECNHGFSDLDDLLTDQLANINGLLGVRGDWRDVPRRASAEDRVDTATIEIDGAGSGRYAEPKTLSERVEGGKRFVRMMFSDEKQLQKWRAKLKQDGLKLEIKSRTKGCRFYPRHLEFSWTFGGESAFREVGRIALNFLAQHRPDLARANELHPFKEYALGRSTGEFVTNDLARVVNGLPTSPFTFGHRVVLSLSREDGQFQSRVSFFDTFHYLVRFGTAPISETATIIIDVDPLAEHPPDDILVRTVSNVAALGGNEESAETCEILLTRSFGRLLENIKTHQWSLTERVLLPRLNALRGQPARERHAAIVELLGNQRQRLLNLLTSVADGLATELSSVAEDLGPAVADVVRKLVKEDVEDDSGLTQEARVALELVRYRVADELTNRLDDRELDGQELRLLLEGGPGAALAGGVIAEPLLGALKGLHGD
jgi:hypothetical protein